VTVKAVSLSFFSTLILVTCGAVGAETQLTPQAAARVRQLKAMVDSFQLDLDDYSCDKGKDDDSLRLSVPADMDSAQANALIDHLAASGFLDQAADHKVYHSKHPAQNACFVMTVTAEQSRRNPGLKPPSTTMCQYEENLGWGFQMLKRLQELRKVLKGSAGKKMDALLGELERHRKEWENEPAPYSRTKVSPRGWELRIWEEKGDTQFSLLPKTDRKRSDAEFVAAAVKDIDVIEAKLKELRSGQMVLILSNAFPKPPPKKQTTRILKYCRTIGLETWLMPGRLD
jgi:hypothetical protein